MSSPGPSTPTRSPGPPAYGDVFSLATPETAMRARNTKRPMPGLFRTDSESTISSTTASPTSTIASLPMSSHSRASTAEPGTPRSFTEALANRSQFRPTGQYTNGSSMRIGIRSDPTLVTCFDPADKELYDLWAPK
ncbi:hypothetical protein OE88DRAFT_1731571 [Heliocybe sulcata]|uniref:Uncharacterized protein n=1 Tax=Heliocybe sulcata TaxID=5364 RepID=A0A5C3NDZ1_9AGAM|nr:hypothetical protein OE88DRAFT_1731571 [Heliocybe sulcata]